jgi:hypothetical protein
MLFFVMTYSHIVAKKQFFAACNLKSKSMVGHKDKNLIVNVHHTLEQKNHPY